MCGDQLRLLSAQGHSQRLFDVERLRLAYTVSVANILHMHHYLGHLLARLALDPHRLHRFTRLRTTDEAARLLFLQRLLYVMWSNLASLELTINSITGV